MSSFNRVIVMGNLTRDPELRYVAKHIAVSDLGLAINDRIKKDGEWTEEVVAIHCVKRALLEFRESGTTFGWMWIS